MVLSRIVLADEQGDISAGVKCPDRQVLLTYADGFLTGLGNKTTPPYLRLVLPCGNIREYLNRDNVPVRSIRCDCGEVDYEHWFIIYTEEESCPS